MADAIELELSYLAKSLPEGLTDATSKELVDVYFPGGPGHPKLRIRQKGERYELTKKTAIDQNDLGNQKEETIVLTKEEFDALAAGDGKRVSKVRYFYPYKGVVAEIDVFDGDLAGLVIVDFEFSSQADKDAFEMPDFCLVDATQEAFIAGGKLAGARYADIEPDLARLGYNTPITM